MSVVNLFRQIIRHNPCIEVLNLECFSKNSDKEVNIGELVFETLLSSRINSIKDLNLGANSSWFWDPKTKVERSCNVDLLAELILK